MDNKLKVAVIGVGYLGEHHARIYSSMEEVELVGIADTDIDRAESIAAKYNTKAFHNYKDLFGKVRAVSIVTPTVLHYQIALDFIRQNTDVMIEKPVSTTVSQANSLIVEADSRGVIIQVGHIERFNPALRIMSEHIKNPRFIESHRVGPFVGRATDVNVILDMMIHDIDIVLSIVKSDVTDIRAVGTPVLTSHIDIANARLEFANGCIADLTASRISREKIRKIRIFQPDTYLSLDYAQQTLTMYRRIIEDNSPKIIEDKITPEKEEPLYAELRSFINAVVSGKRPLVSCEDGRDALAIALKVQEDAEKRLSGNAESGMPNAESHS